MNIIIEYAMKSLMEYHVYNNKSERFRNVVRNGWSDKNVWFSERSTVLKQLYPEAIAY